MHPTAYLFVLVLILPVYSIGQSCPIPNNSFEDWIDLSYDLDSSRTIPAETTLLPEYYFSYSRQLDTMFSDSIGNILDSTVARQYFGVARSEDATEGDFALKISGNQLARKADLAATFACNGQLPTSMNLDIKHVGTGLDTLEVLLTLGEKIIVPDNLFNLFGTSGFIIGEAIANNNTNWATIELPIRDNGAGISADSVFLWFVVHTDIEKIANQEESYFLVDNLSFSDGSTSISEEFVENINIYPNPFDDKIFIENDGEHLSGVIYDLEGRKVDKIDILVGHNSYHLSELNTSGTYLLVLSTNNGSQQTTYNLIKR